MAQTKVAVDPVLGRIVFPADTTDAVLVTFHYGFIADIGGGEYDRGATEALPQPVRDVPASRATIAQALGDVAGAGTVEITGSGAYPETPMLAAAANARLVLRAANGGRPLVSLGGDLIVTGGDSGEVVLDGLLIAGGA